MSFEGKDDQSTSDNNSFDNVSKEADNAPYAVAGDREFATQADLEKHTTSAQSHIQILEEENKGFKERESILEAAAQENVSARELLDSIKQAGTKTESSETPSKSQEEVVAETVAIAKSQLREEFKSDAQKELETRNVAVAMESAEKAHGEKFIDVVLALGKTHGLTPKDVNNLAKTSPLAFNKLFVPEDKSSAGPTDSDLNTAAYNQPAKESGFTSILSKTDNKSRASFVEQKLLAAMENQS